MLLTHVYPTFASFKAIEDAASGRVEGLGVEHWLKFWVVCGVAALLEGIVHGLFFWIPFYSVFRLVFVVWLYLPLTSGAQAIYAVAVAPLLRRHRPTCDAYLGRVSGKISSIRARDGKGQDDHLASNKFNIEDVMAHELAKAAAGRLGEAAAGAAAGLLRDVATPGKAVRARTASPRPSPPGPQKAEDERD